MSTRHERLASMHVFVAGAGGIGCPAAWALVEAGVGRVTLADPDVVERSNLPRQVLFGLGDLGAPKAPRAAAALGAKGRIQGVHAPLDDTNQAALLEGVDVLVDATDGAHAKDWLNQLAVRRGLPLVHAAGLRAEARVMSIAAGGAPCLACLFGRLQEETGSCADLGVWNGAVGVVGFLAAEHAVQRVLGEAAPETRYAVLDFEAGRATPLRVEAAAGCPVCGDPGAPVEAYPAPFACAVEPSAARPPAVADALDLREEHCPLNLLRARRALADLPAGARLAIRLGAEGAATVPDGVRALGHRVLVETPAGTGLDLDVEVVGAREDDPAFDGEVLQHFARQIVLPEFGERGQKALGEASVWLGGAGLAHASARTYLVAAGVGAVLDASTPPEGATLVAWAGGADAPALPAGALALERKDGACRAARAAAVPLGAYDVAAPVALAWGALLADLVQRALVVEAAPSHSLTIEDGGGVR